MNDQERKPQSGAAPVALMVIGALIAWGPEWIGVTGWKALSATSVLGYSLLIAGFIWLLVRVAKDAENAVRTKR